MCFRPARIIASSGAIFVALSLVACAADEEPSEPLNPDCKRDDASLSLSIDGAISADASWGVEQLACSGAFGLEGVALRLFFTAPEIGDPPASTLLSFAFEDIEPSAPLGGYGAAFEIAASDGIWANVDSCAVDVTRNEAVDGVVFIDGSLSCLGDVLAAPGVDKDPITLRALTFKTLASPP